MNTLNISIHKASYLTRYWEELKRIVKNFAKIYNGFLNGEFTNEPDNRPSQAIAQPEELPKYLWI